MVMLFAVSDLHLSTACPEKKSMRGYGGAWAEHPESLYAAWAATVPAEAVVLVPGDISWGLKREHVQADLAVIDALPGAVKVLTPGNHDYGVWKTQGQIERSCEPFPTLLPLVSGRAARLDTARLVVASVKGATLPTDPWFDPDSDQPKRYQRELGRLEKALAEAQALRAPGDRLVVMCHYPPAVPGTGESEFTQRIEAAGGDICVFGHLHNESEWVKARAGLNGDRPTRYELVGCDALGMRPLELTA